MSAFVLGFGSEEARERTRIKEALREGAAHGLSPSQVLQPWHEAADRYKKMDARDAPERYTHAWVYGGEIHFHHINRRHAFSPDGWALLQVTEPWPHTPGVTDDE